MRPTCRPMTFFASSPNCSNLEDFEKDGDKRVEPALESLNKLLKRTGLIAFLDASGRCHLRNTGTGVTSATMQQPRPLSQEEILHRQKLEIFSGLGFIASVLRDIRRRSLSLARTYG